MDTAITDIERSADAEQDLQDRPVSAGHSVLSSDVRLQVCTDIDAIASIWRALETQDTSTVYQRHDWAVIALSFFAGAFNTEIFRAGIEAVPKSTTEAAQALGYSRFQIYRYITFPLAYRVCLPALNNNLVNLVKTTTVAYAIAVPETLYISNQIWSDEYNVPEMMNVVWVVYILLVGVLVWLMHRWEKAIRVPGFGQ